MFYQQICSHKMFISPSLYARQHRQCPSESLLFGDCLIMIMMMQTFSTLGLLLLLSGLR